MNPKQQARSLAEELIDQIPQLCQVFDQTYQQIRVRQTSFLSQDVAGALDEAIEMSIKQLISQYPDVVLDSEESILVSTDKPVLVRLDPVDGSKHVKAGIELGATCLTIEIDNQVEFALIINLFSQTAYWQFRDEDLCTNQLNQLEKPDHGLKIESSFVMIEPNLNLKDKALLEFTNQITRQAYRVRCVGIAGLALAWLASGSVSAWIDLSLTTKWYDVQAGIFLCEQRGMKVGHIKQQQLIDGLPQEFLGEKKKIGYPMVVATPTAYKQINQILTNDVSV